MKLMGILNVTPDSFSDGNQYNTDELILKQVSKMISEGADIIDIGGESTRPGAIKVSQEEELNRIIPIIKLIQANFEIEISIDTYKPQVALESLKLGVNYINDVHGSFASKQMLEIISTHNCKYILMHCNENIRNMEIEGKELINQIIEDITPTIDNLLKLGYRKENIIIDPGIGFYKKHNQSLSIIANLDYLKKKTNYEVLLGASRKSSLAEISGIEEAEKRDIPTAVTSVLAQKANIDYVRVHNIQTNREAINTFKAIYEYRK